MANYTLMADVDHEYLHNAHRTKSAWNTEEFFTDV